MTITKITASHFKGLTFSHDLSPLVHISGPNFAGKSARMDAIRLALLGHLPEVGKTPGATITLSDGTTLSVCATLSTGDRIVREFTKTTTGASASGAKEPFKAPMLNAGAYFAMTESERLAYVTSQMELPEGASAVDILRDLRAALPAGESAEEVREKIIAKVEEVFDEDSVQDAIEKLLTKKTGWMAAEYSYYNGRQKDTIGAVRTYTELKNREGECSAETLSGIDTEARQIEADLAAANRRQGELASAQMQANRTARRRSELEDVIVAQAPSEDHANELAAALKEIKARAPLPEGKTLAQMRPEWDDVVERDHSSDAALRAATNKRLAVHKQVEELEHLKACPYCQSKGKAWKKTLEDKYTEELGLATLEESRATEARNTIMAERLKLHEAMEIRETLEKAETDARQKEQRLLTDLTHEERRIQEHKAKVDNAGKELQNLAADAPSAEIVHQVAQEVADLTAKQTEIHARRLTAIALQQDLKRAAEAFEEHEKANAGLEAVTAAGKFLREKQGQTVATLMYSLLEKANALFAGIMKAPLAMHEGEIGYFTPAGQFVTHRTFSGTEQALTYIAVSAALSTEGNIRIVLLDEFGRVDPENKTKVLNALRDAKDAGYIDQAVIIDTVPATAEGWQAVAL